MTKPCKCGKKIVEKEAEEKKDDEETKDEEKSENKNKKIDEADTEASGEDLKQKVRKAIQRAFNIKNDDTENQVELINLPEFKEGYNVYFFKLSFKK